MDRSDRLRVLHLTAGSDAGGISRYLLDLCSAMHEAGHEVAIAGEQGAWHDRFINMPWTWIDAPLKGGPLKLAKATNILRDYLSRHPVDVIHTHYRKPTLVARRLQRQTGNKILYTLHLSHIPIGGIRGWLSDFGDHVHAAASDARDWLIQEARVPAERVTLIPHGIPIDRFPIVDAESRHRARQDLALADSNRVALYVGRLDWPKNEGWLLDLAAGSRTQIPELRVLLAGAGPNEQSLARRIVAEGLGDRVRLLGECDPLPLYHAADALLLASQREGFSYSCAEAMCAGIPVLRTRTSGTRELIVEGVTGRSVEIQRERFLSAAVDFLADDASLSEMGTGAALHVRQNFTLQKQIENTLALYRTLAG
jgi:glycosyltransferase involved in cell wall biosynthesis